ncbi:MAG: DUF4142 domain-containing protein [Nitrospira sp.]
MRAIISVATVVILSAIPILSLSAAPSESLWESFLKTAAQEHQAEIALGQLAIQKAESADVKEFAAKMLQEHQQASLEVQQLAMKEGVTLPKRISDKQKIKLQQLAQLSGRSFDLAYIQYMLQDHTKDVNEFEQTAERLQNQNLKHWAFRTLPVLKQQLVLASSLATSLDSMNLFSEQPTRVPQTKYSSVDAVPELQ